MKLKTLFTFILALSISMLSHATPKPTPKAPSLNANSFYLIDFESGVVLAEKNPHKKVEPASITKLMSMYLVDKALADGQLQLTDTVTISEKAWRMKGSKMFIEVGKEISVQNLIKGMVIQSGNDATIALAEHIAGSEDAFVGYMNHRAEMLGMKNTQFKNATGWPEEGHYSTAHDIAILAQAIIREFPASYAYYKEKEFTFNKIRQFNRNRLLWRDDSVDGLKTGHTEAAGYCLVASAMREDMRLISVVLGAKSDKARTKYSQSLINYGFRYFETHKLYSAKETLKEAPIWFGTQEQVSLGIETDLFINIPKGRYKDLNATIEVDSNIEAPISEGQELGAISIKLDGKELSSLPIVALHSVEDGGLIKKAMDSVKRVFK
ncbi:MAG: D-alanyl-D-alanine carboxypeptidase [Gammaproteobacteria bacterium]|nr:D-alanyl-D-alanine carboxypeptidase [Gammaproteobacteria bacterium]